MWYILAIVLITCLIKSMLNGTLGMVLGGGCLGCIPGLIFGMFIFKTDFNALIICTAVTTVIGVIGAMIYDYITGGENRGYASYSNDIDAAYRADTRGDSRAANYYATKAISDSRKK